ncbi:MAG TPA: NRAMP family divalent metal transporter [Chitinophagaceae bacterium]|nr:NRAMP family divalent metal transporter [Chitinophagaceae bacterium]
MKRKLNRQVFLGAAFLMATSAIGPGFLTQTTVFTNQLLASCGAVILLSVILDVVAQLNIWRIITVSGKKASVLANELLPGVGHFLTVIIVLGGLAFNIGNISGAGLGLNVLFNISVQQGAAISAFIAILVFVLKEAGDIMDWFVKILGVLMIGLTLYIAIITDPPLKEVIVKSIYPTKFSWLSVITLVGGTVGGYITFAGAHRLLDAGIRGKESLQLVSKSSITAILLASLMRALLFLAALGVVIKGYQLSKDNPAASVYEFAAGKIGYKIFGIVMWAASITSVVGSSYTSISFLKTLHPSLEKRSTWHIVLFILISTIIFIQWGKPIVILIWAGTINGFILPLSLGIMLCVINKKRIFADYRHPILLTVMGWIVVALMLWMSFKTLWEQF